MDKRSLTERDICTKFILPAVKRAGWDEMLQVREEVYFTQGADHRSRQAGHARQGEEGRLRSLLQAQHPDRADRG
jgi:type I site-specific restriction endonuclease